MKNEDLQFPSSDTDPKKKSERDWMLKNAKAFWYNTARGTADMFNAKRQDYELWRLYAMGEQSNADYKKFGGVDARTGQSWNNISWKVIGFITTKMESIIAKMMKDDYRVVATPIDMQGRGEHEKYFANLKANLMIQKQSPRLAGHPLIQNSPTDPQSLEELQMRLNFGEQFNRAEDAELATELMFYRNNIEQIKFDISQDLIYYGVGCVYDDLDENNEPKLGSERPRDIITNFCHKNDFSDLTHWARIIEVDKGELLPFFERKDLDGIKTGYENGKLDGTHENGKVKVACMEFLSTDTIVYENDVDRFGNVAIPRADFAKRNSGGKYERKDFKVWYSCKWIIGTDLIYQYGPKGNQKRTVEAKNKANSYPSLHIIAPNFYKMKAKSIMERIIPLIDDWQVAYNKLQTIKANMVTNGFAIDIEALEEVALSNAGKKMSKKEILDMFFTRGILLFRRKDMAGATNNAKPIEAIVNSVANEMSVIFQDMQNTLAMIDSTLGLNDMTGGGTPSSKMLNGVANMLTENTDNALWPVLNAKRQLIEKLGGGAMMRLRQCLELNGNYDGFMPGLSSSVLKFIQADKGLSERDFAIKMELKPTDDQKQILYQFMEKDIDNGNLDSSDFWTIINTFNMKQAVQMLSYKIMMNKQKAQQNAMQQQQMNGQVQQQSAAQTQEAAIKLETIQTQGKAYLIKLQGDINYRNLQLQFGSQAQIADSSNQTKTTHALIASNTKKDIEKMKLGEHVPDFGEMNDVAPMPPIAMPSSPVQLPPQDPQQQQPPDPMQQQPDPQQQGQPMPQ